ncbi:HDIG domain-containing protein [candidate division KSB1 bacterium]|nr:HDIG domain-containing protein [candidate division KSB1 bacterium]
MNFIRSIFTKRGEEEKQRRVHRWEWLSKGAIGVGLALFLVLLFPRGKSFQFADLKLGSVAPKEIIAPFDFEILKSDEELEKDRQEAREKVHPVFNWDMDIRPRQLKQLENFFSNIEKVVLEEKKYLIEASLNRRMARKIPQQRLVADSLKVDSLKSDLVIKYRLDFPPEGWAFFQRLSLERSSSGVTGLFKNTLLKIISDIFRTGVIDRDKNSFNAPNSEIVARRKGIDIIRKLAGVLTEKEAENKARMLLQGEFSSSGSAANDSVRYGLFMVVQFVKPNIFFDPKETQKREKRAVEKVPLAKGIVLKNERIIDSNEIAKPDHLRKIESLRIKRAEIAGERQGWMLFLPHFGKALFVGFIILIFALFLRTFRPQIFQDNRLLLLIALILLGQILITSLVIEKFQFSSYLIPVALGAMLLTILFDWGLGFIGVIVISLLVGAIMGGEFGVSVICFLVGTVALFAVRRVRRRSQLLMASLYLIAAYIVAITAVRFLRYSFSSEIFTDFFYGTANSVFSPLLTYMFLFVFENLFDVTSDVRLLELSDLNRPLLRQLATETPGTYNHSILIGNLSEAAAEACQANSLLARVGSYYHDIGKMEKPEYFIENQTGGENKHDKLQPSMSCLILAAHIKDGLKLAEENRLPKALTAFIEQHHGTSIMTYFYQKALQSTPRAKLNLENFRYPGPKPQSKEAGIVMLADGIEAAARSLQTPTPSRIKGVVNDIVKDRFEDGQLDECWLTLKDLDLIKQSFVRILTGIYHGRVEYPKAEEVGGVKKVRSKPAKIKT